MLEKEEQEFKKRCRVETNQALSSQKDYFQKMISDLNYEYIT
jgi:hypothetical protein